MEMTVTVKFDKLHIDAWAVTKEGQHIRLVQDFSVICEQDLDEFVKLIKSSVNLSKERPF